MEAYLGKPYKLQSSENFDEYMKALGVGLVTRKIGNSISSTVTLSKEGDKYALKIESTFKNQVLTFSLDQELDEETQDGRKVKTLFSIEGNKLIQKQKGDKVDSMVVREYFSDKMTTTCTVGNVVCIRHFVPA